MLRRNIKLTLLAILCLSVIAVIVGLKWGWWVVVMALGWSPILLLFLWMVRSQSKLARKLDQDAEERYPRRNPRR